MGTESFADPRLPAWIILFAYLAVLIIILPREASFLQGVDPPERRKFITLDLLIQVFILLVLLPPAMSKLDSLFGFLVLGVGFVGLWIVVIWTAMARYRYVHQFLARHQSTLKEEFEIKLKDKSTEDQPGD